MSYDSKPPETPPMDSSDKAQLVFWVVFWTLAFTLTVLFAGEPDLMDAFVGWIGRH